MKNRDVVIGFIFLVILIAGVLWIFRVKKPITTSFPLPTPNIVQKVRNAFPNLKVPANADRANLTDISGGLNVGEAIRSTSNGIYTLTVVINAPAPSYGSFYQASLSNGTKTLILGKLVLSKSGYLLNFTSRNNYSGYNKVIISLQNSPVLEGSF